MIMKSSAYVRTSVYSRNGQAYIFGIREKFKFDKDAGTYYTVTQGDTLDGIAFRYYGNARFTWALLDANSMQSELDMNVGDVLFIPNFEEVARISG